MKSVDNIPYAINTGGPEGYTTYPPATEVEHNESLTTPMPPSNGGNFVLMPQVDALHHRR